MASVDYYGNYMPYRPVLDEWTFRTCERCGNIVSNHTHHTCIDKPVKPVDSGKEQPMLDINGDLKKTLDELDAYRVHRDQVLRTRQRLQDEAFQLRKIAELKIQLASRVAQEVSEEVALDEDDDTA